MNRILAFVREKKEIIAYLFWGGLTTVVNWGTYTIGVSCFRLSISVANAIAWFFAVAFAFITNKLYVFNSKSFSKEIFFRELSMFVSARLVTGLFEIIAVPVLVWLGMHQKIGGVEGSLAKILVSILVVLMNYVISKKLIFRKKK